jgi:3-hydroxyisobutyrate dehydrogenase-like beta-hydroxyacid dehydrogenase
VAPIITKWSVIASKFFNLFEALGLGLEVSTLSVALSQRLQETHTQAGSAYVAAPVFGRPEAAAAAQLFIVAAGPREAIERLHPLFEAMGQRTFVVGEDAPAANLVKLTGNFLIASVIESLGEAFAVVRKYGIDPHQYLEILTNTLFSAPVYKTYGSLIGLKPTFMIPGAISARDDDFVDIQPCAQVEMERAIGVDVPVEQRSRTAESALVGLISQAVFPGFLSQDLLKH